MVEGFPGEECTLPLEVKWHVEIDPNSKICQQELSDYQTSCGIADSRSRCTKGLIDKNEFEAD